MSYRLLAKAGVGGIAAIVDGFVKRHPTISKRQCEIKIAEVAEKEKWPGDASKMWHVKPEYEKYVRMEDGNASSSSSAEASGRCLFLTSCGS